MRSLLLAAWFSLLIPALALADTPVPQLMGEAQRAFITGDYDTAKDLFNQVLEADPQNTLAIQFLHRINVAQAGAQATPAADLLEKMVIPVLSFKNATFTAALDLLKQQAVAQGITVSFVPQLPESQMNKTVTLSLSEIPFMEALRYICSMNNAAYKVEPYAIVILPAAVTAAPAAGQ